MADTSLKEVGKDVIYLPADLAGKTLQHFALLSSIYFSREIILIKRSVGSERRSLYHRLTCQSNIDLF